MTVIEALKGLKADNLTQEALRDSLAAVNYAGVTGGITFDENGDANKDMAYIKTMTDGGFQVHRHSEDRRHLHRGISGILTD